MRIGVGLSIPELATRGGRFSPASLFTAGTVGAWYDPSDYSTLFQDSAGTTPVTAVEQPVRLMLDKSQGLVLGSELVTNGDFATDTGWTKDGGTTISGGAAVFNGTPGSSLIYQSAAVVIGKTYKITFTVTSRTSGTLTCRLFGGTSGFSATAPGTYVFYDTPTTINTNVGFYSSGGFVGTADNISIKELPGNHALAPNDASRPVLRARYNLLTYSEQFDNAVWVRTGIDAFGSGSVANATTAPDGTTTADFIRPGTVSSSQRFTQNPSPAQTAQTLSVYVKASGYSKVALKESATTGNYASFDLSTGTVLANTAGVGTSITALANSWYRISMTLASAGSCGLQVSVLAPAYTTGDPNSSAFSGDGTSGMFVWGAQLVTGSSAGTYQRIAAATDYATAGFLPYLALDGTDDSFGTNSVNFTGTDKMFVCAGLTKLNTTAAFNCLLEFGASGANGIGIFAPDSNNNNYSFWLKGQSRPTSTSVYVAPITNVISVQHDCAEATAALQTKPRINGASVSIATSTAASAGNFANEAMFIGRRNNASLPFNGRIYQMVVCGKALSASELASTEAYVNARTGAY